MDFPDATPSAMALASFCWLAVLYRWSRQPRRPPPCAAHARPLPGDVPLVSIIVPARNEALRIRACLRSLLAQSYPSFEVILVDDRSEDDTASIASALAAGDCRLRVLTGDPVPAGALGKTQALLRGFREARGDWLVFTDADTEHAPFLLSNVMAHALDAGAGFATVVGRQRAPTFGVHLANLAVFASIFFLADPKSWNHPRSRQSLVNGQYLLFSREAYLSIGTHAAIEGYSSTDISLGYIAKMAGRRALLIDGRAGLTTTMYEDYRGALRGWSRSIVNVNWTALGPVWGSIAPLGLTAILSLFWIGPWIALALGLVHLDVSSAAPGLLGVLAGFALLAMAHGRLGPAIRHTLLMPLSQANYILLVALGLSQAWRLGGTMWKGRLVRTTRRLPPWRPREAETPSGR